MKTAGRTHLVVGGYGIEKPDVVMSLIVFIVFVVGVARLRIELDLFDFRFMGGGQGFLASQLLGRLSTFGPIIAVVADGNNCLRRIEFLHPGYQSAFIPVLRRYGSPLLSGVVLVVGHQR